MKDRRSVDDLSIEELERILALRKRQAREEKLRRFRASGRAAAGAPESPAPEEVEPQAGPGGFIFRATPDGVHPIAEGEGGARPRRGAWNSLLLLVEIGAVAALIWIAYSGFAVLQSLNRESAQVNVAPTPSPTPLITAVVLPSGHTPPTSPGGPQPNDAEIPEHLRPLVQAAAPIIIPTSSPQQAVRIVIAAIGVDAPVVMGDSWEQLKKGVAQHIGAADPGQAGNIVLSAHNDIFGEIFRDLDQLEEGDEIVIYTQFQSFTYVVKSSRIVLPTEVSVMDPTQSPTFTLISCYPYLVDNQRIVVQGDLTDS